MSELVSGPYTIKDHFDVNDPKNIGRPQYFDLKLYIAAVEMMICADEIQIALKMLDDVPSWYRDNYPKELTEIKNTLYKNLEDQIEYANDDGEASCEREFGEGQWNSSYCYPRAQILEEKLKTLKKPWIFDLGCSHGNMPLGLIKNGFDFNYYGVAMNWRIAQKVKAWVGERWQERPMNDQPSILVCTEVLEHVMNPHDLIHSAKKIGVEYDFIYLSTPKGCLGHGLPNWKTRPLGHVRGYTPNEFIEFAEKAFKGYSWKLYDAYSMVLEGEKI